MYPPLWMRPKWTLQVSAPCLCLYIPMHPCMKYACRCSPSLPALNSPCRLTIRIGPAPFPSPIIALCSCFCVLTHRGSFYRTQSECPINSLLLNTDRSPCLAHPPIGRWEMSLHHLCLQGTNLTAAATEYFEFIKIHLTSNQFYCESCGHTQRWESSYLSLHTFPPRQPPYSPPGPEAQAHGQELLRVWVSRGHKDLHILLCPLRCTNLLDPNVKKHRAFFLGHKRVGPSFPATHWLNDNLR